jgi:response regulator RpfG family c-di-GMP phosphodiesterase
MASALHKQKRGGCVMAEKVLFVDDEENVLSALKRQFRKRYDVCLASSGADGLTRLVDEGPFAVVVSDMQMPEMNGVQFLQAAQKLSPDTVRLMLTGNADQQTAVDAVNQGCVFSFYTKPCAPEVLQIAIEKAIDQYHLITAERELLEGTLNGSVKLLLDMLSMIAPDVFGRTVALQVMVKKLTQQMQLEDTWHLELATMLSNIACITLPPETLAKTCSGEALSPQEELMVTRLPEVGKNLITNIPRLERVAEIVLYQNKQFDGGGFPRGGHSGDDIPLESRILNVVHDLEKYKSQGFEDAHALKRMLNETGRYDPSILQSMASVIGSDNSSANKGTPVNTTLNGLQPGHILVSHIENIEGKLLCAAGHKITDTIIERLINYNQITRIKEPIQVIVNDSGDLSADAMALAV